MVTSVWAAPYGRRARRARRAPVCSELPACAGSLPAATRRRAAESRGVHGARRAARGAGPGTLGGAWAVRAVKTGRGQGRWRAAQCTL
jgi:hypothetical protein